MELNKEIIKGHIESIILSTIKDEDLYGYDIAKRIRELSNDVFELKEGTLYVVLKRLENNGLVSSYWGEESTGGGRRRYFKISKDGREYLKTKKREWEFLSNILEIYFKGV